MAKTKNVMDFSPAATRIYNAAKRGITNRTNPSHVKRIIDKELDKHSLSKEKIAQQILDGVTKGSASEIEKTESRFEKIIGGLKKELKKITGKETTEGEKVFEEQVLVLQKEAVELKERNDAQVKSIKDLTEELSTRPPLLNADPKQDESNDASPDPDQEKKPADKKKNK